MPLKRKPLGTCSKISKGGTLMVALHLNGTDRHTLHFDADVRVGDYSGHTDFWVVRDDLERFLRDLEHLDRHLKGEASIRCGWGDDVYFALAARPEGSTGKLLVLVEIAALADSGPMHRLSTSFVLPDPNALSRFNKALRAALVASSEGPAGVLSPEPLPAGA